MSRADRRKHREVVALLGEWLSQDLQKVRGGENPIITRDTYTLKRTASSPGPCGEMILIFPQGSDRLTLTIVLLEALQAIGEQRIWVAEDGMSIVLL